MICDDTSIFMETWESVCNLSRITTTLLSAYVVPQDGKRHKSVSTQKTLSQ